MRILDVGCGPGIYVTALRNLGLQADGVDPDPRCPYDKLSVFHPQFDMYRNYDICLCLEVAEHIDPELADKFVEKLVGVAPTVIFSAAQPGQGGHGHINCQPKEYWAHKFGCHNYVYDAEATTRLCGFMQLGYHMGWFVNNVQIFRQYGAVCFDQIVKEETPQAERLADYLKREFVT
ncbi:MAG: methyltransferase domain-containing protein [Betaproteobacteria bacterium]|nr:methyltransferase domain-containing protein [Betaproteobacteria bacterium]